MKKHIFFSVIAAVMFLAGNTVMAGDKEPSGTVVIDETQVMIIIGGSKGGGTLLIGDNSYSFKTGGLKLGIVGIQDVHVTGDVYDLNDVKDFPGAYLQLEADATLGEGVGGLWMKNSKGVSMHLKSNNEGLALSVGVTGLKITMN
jgi:hypothetical protein